MPKITIDIHKKTRDILTMDEAAMTSMAVAEAGREAGHTTENIEFACFMCAMQWVLYDLSKAALNDRLLHRLLELQMQFELIAKDGLDD